MKFDISGIEKTDGSSLQIEYNNLIEDLDSILGHEFLFNAPVEFSGSLTNVGGILKLNGRLKAGYTVGCYRCLKEIRDKLDLLIREEFVNAGENMDVEAYTYEDGFIELDKVLIDNIILNLPMKQMCSEECKGICPVCGADLNYNECNCRTDAIHPGMEALKNFFKN